MVLSVQAKLDYPVLETRLSDFHELTPPPPGQNLPLHHFSSLLSLSLSLKNNHEGDPKIPIGDFLIPL
jgi:hypothetical protein